MSVSTLNAQFFTPLLKNLNKENKEVVLIEDFNLNLLNFGKKRGTHQFSEQLFHNNYTPQVSLPTRITDRSATLIDNIFLNTQLHKQTSVNITLITCTNLIFSKDFQELQIILEKNRLPIENSKTSMKLNLYVISRASTSHMEPKEPKQMLYKRYCKKTVDHTRLL